MLSNEARDLERPSAVAPTEATTLRPALFLAWFGTLAVLIVCAFAAWRDLGRPRLGIDDANIFFVYAQHLAHGQGFVYNLGGEHVEGASSLLFLFLCTLIWRIAEHPEFVLFGMEFLFLLIANGALIYLLSVLGAKWDIRPRVWLALPSAYLLWICLSPSYFDWALISLMDTGLYSLLIVLSFTLLILRAVSERTPSLFDAGLFSVLVSCTVLVRPEGFAWGLLSASLFFWVSTTTRGKTLLPVIPFFTYALTSGSVTLFRKLYFGYPLPNTFYAKVSASRIATLKDGLAALHSFVSFYGLFVLAPLLFILALLLFARPRLHPQSVRVLAITAAYVALGLAIPVLEGGDNFDGFRPFQAIYPLLAFSAALPALSWTSQRRARRPNPALVATAALSAVFALTTHSTWTQFRRGNVEDVPVVTPTTNRVNYDLVPVQRNNGRQLRSIFAGQLPRIGIAAAGAIAYTYHGPVDDLMGLNDTRLAHAAPVKVNYAPKGHQSFNEDLFFRYPPDILLPLSRPSGQPLQLEEIGNVNLSEDDFENEIFQSVFNERSFWRSFELAAVRRNNGPALVCIGYFRRDYLETLLHGHAYTLLGKWSPPDRVLTD